MMQEQADARKTLAEGELSRVQLQRQLEDLCRQREGLKQDAHKLKQGAVNAQLEMLTLSEGLGNASQREAELEALVQQHQLDAAADRQLRVGLEQKLGELQVQGKAQEAKARGGLDKNRFIRHVVNEKKGFAEALEQGKQAVQHLEAANTELSVKLEAEVASNREQMLVVASLDNKLRDHQHQLLVLEERSKSLTHRADAAEKREGEAVEQLVAERSCALKATTEKDEMKRQHQNLINSREEQKAAALQSHNECCKLQQDLTKLAASKQVAEEGAADTAEQLQAMQQEFDEVRWVLQLAHQDDW